MKTAFYQKPVSVKTSIEIINEARASIRLVDTTRPSTPLDLSEHSGLPPSLRRASSQSRQLSLFVSKLDPLPPSDCLRQRTSSLQDLVSFSETSKQKQTRVKPGSSDGKRSAEETQRPESRKNWDSESLSTLLRLLEEFVTHSDVLLDDRKAIASLIEMIVNFQQPTDEQFVQLRSELLRKIFQTLQSKENPSVHGKLKQIELALTLGLNDANMINMCKLAYKICRSLNRGALFVQDETKTLPIVLLHALSIGLNTSKDTQLEPMTYCLACLKLVSADDVGAKCITGRNGVQIVTNKLLLILSTIDPSGKSEKNEELVANICLQLLGVLRNLSEVNNAMELFRNSNTFAALFDTMICFNGSADVVLMCSRVLSKASLDRACCCCIAEVLQPQEDDKDSINTFLFMGNILLQYSENQDISVRLAFTVGNLVTEYPECTAMLMKDNVSGEKALDLFVVIFKNYVMKMRKLADKPEAQYAEHLELTTKAARLLANSATDEPIGKLLALSQDFLDACLSCLSVMEIGRDKKGSIYENAITAILAALNNVTCFALDFLNNPVESETVIWYKRLEFTNALIPYMLLHHKSPLLLDALHVIANFCRFPDVRQQLFDLRILELCLALVDGECFQLSFVTCGILVNFSIDPEARQLLMKSNCLEKIHGAITSFANPSFLKEEKNNRPFCLPLVDVSCKLLLNLTGVNKPCSFGSNHKIIKMKLHKLFSELLGCLRAVPKLPNEEDITILLDKLIPTLLSRLEC